MPLIHTCKWSTHASKHERKHCLLREEGHQRHFRQNLLHFLRRTTLAARAQARAAKCIPSVSPHLKGKKNKVIHEPRSGTAPEAMDDEVIVTLSDKQQRKQKVGAENVKEKTPPPRKKHFILTVSTLFFTTTRTSSSDRLKSKAVMLSRVRNNRKQHFWGGLSDQRQRSFIMAASVWKGNVHRLLR